MALAVKDRVRETSTTSGTGTLTLAGAVAGFQAFSVIGNANTTYYGIVDATTGDWEVGIGTYTLSGTTLSRTTVLSSSNAGSLVNFAANSKDVFVTYPSSKSVYLDASGNVIGLGTPAAFVATNVTGLPLTTGVTGVLPVANGGTGVTSSTGTGSTVLSASPTFTGTLAAAIGTFSSTLAVTGITTVAAGTAALPSIISTTGTADTGEFFPAADTIAWSTAGTERMRIDSSGLVGINNNSPSSLNVAAYNLVVGDGAASNKGISIYCGTANYGSIHFADGTSGANAYRGVINYYHADNSMAFYTDAAERMRIDATGFVGIGTTTPSSFNSNAYNLVVGSGSGAKGITIYTGTASYGSIHFADGTAGADSYRGIVRYNHADNHMDFCTDAAERMRITSAGNLLIGSTATLGSTAAFEITGPPDVMSLRYYSAGSGTYVRFICNSNNDLYISNADFTQYVYKDYAGNTWGSSSDERLKDIIEPITDGLNKVLKLRSVIGKFKTDEDGKRRSFLIAQDVLEVLPEAVQLTNNHIANREEYVLYYSDVIPLLVSAIKDLKTITEAQAARITALETL